MLKLLELLRHNRRSAPVGRNPLEQLHVRLQRDLHALAALEQQYPDRLAPGLFFAWQRHDHLKRDCQRGAAAIGRRTASTAEAVLTDALAAMADNPHAVPEATRQVLAAGQYRRWFGRDPEDSDDDLSF